MQALAICTNFSRHVLCEIMALRCLHDMWSGPGVEDNEHLAIASLNSWLEKGGHSMLSAWGSSLRSLVLTSLFSAELYDLCRAFHRSERVLHRQFLYEMDSMAGKDFFLTQLIRSQGLLLDDVISWILLLKNSLLTVHTTDLNSFQCLRSPDSRYLLRPSVQSWFHYSCKEAKLQARIKPTAFCSAIDKENLIESPLDFAILYIQLLSWLYTLPSTVLMPVSWLLCHILWPWLCDSVTVTWYFPHSTLVII